MLGKASCCISNIHVVSFMAVNHVTSKQQQCWIPLKICINSGKTFYDISFNTGQICMRFEADIRKNDSNRHNLCGFQTKIWLKSK